MKDAITYGNRLIMMDAGRVVLDVSGEEKKKLTVPELIEHFGKSNSEATDKMLLS
jgi:putative ABC transport system ATP-binding protein